MSVFLWILLINWGAPLLLWAYPLTMTLLFKEFEFKGFVGPFAKFKLVNNGLASWHATLWAEWYGVGLYGFLCYRDKSTTADDSWVTSTIKHESVHCWQWLALGLLFYVSYFTHVLLLLCFRPDKHPYLDCWAERMARKYAGQKVDFSRAEWPSGPRDRWPWW
jgi:hypothetical protein